MCNENESNYQISNLTLRSKILLCGKVSARGVKGCLINPFELFLIPASAPQLCYPVYGVGHIKEPLLLIGNSPCSGSSVFLLSLSEWSLPYVQCHLTVNRMY